MPTAITVTVRLFARARDLAARDFITWTLATPASVGDLRGRLLREFPQLSPLGTHLLAAVNGHFVGDAELVAYDAELAFFPPVSGG